MLQAKARTGGKREPGKAIAIGDAIMGGAAFSAAGSDPELQRIQINDPAPPFCMLPCVELRGATLSAVCRLLSGIATELFLHGRGIVGLHVELFYEFVGEVPYSVFWLSMARCPLLMHVRMSADQGWEQYSYSSAGYSRALGVLRQL